MAFLNSLVIYRRNLVYKNKAVLLLCLVVIVVYLYTFQTTERIDYHQQGYIYNGKEKIKSYLINTSTCKIPKLNPYNDDVNHYVYRVSFKACTKLGLLSYITKSNGIPTLNINESMVYSSHLGDISCCYSNITRTNIEDNDDDIEISRCVSFQRSVRIFQPFIQVRCSDVSKKVIYKNVHATTLPINHKIDINHIEDKFSVLIIGIDSISKLNLQRTMPRTHRYLEHNWINLKGYNKIGDNTFPNLMAILSGQNGTELSNICRRKRKMNYCNILWNTFKDSNYITAYAEDFSAISTFNYDNPGFEKAPTDYYYRPYVLAAEKLPNNNYYSYYCTGPETLGGRILDAARDFSTSFPNNPSFGLFWMNSFSHENINLPSSMDDKIYDVLNDHNFQLSINNTFVIFLSDHGFRFGDIRFTHSGWLEERLPFIYLHVPESFKKKYPRQHENLLTNTERLTTPYDLYLTLQDILKMGNHSYELKKSRGCPQCSSLFEVISENRTCLEASIEHHWCTCNGFAKVNPKDASLIPIRNFVILEINKIVESYTEGRRCTKYSFGTLSFAGISTINTNTNGNSSHYYLLMIQLVPSSMYEATVEVYYEEEQPKFKISGDISRLNRYADNSHCVKTRALKKYCYCSGFWNKIHEAFCSIFYC